jgi:hypothetical protein
MAFVAEESERDREVVTNMRVAGVADDACVWSEDRKLDLRDVGVEPI